MLFKFLLTEFSKSKIFSRSQKLDHVTNYYKRPIRFLSDVFGCCHLESLLPWERDETTFPLHLTTNLIRGSLRLPSFADWSVNCSCLVPRRIKCGKRETRLHEPSRSIAQWTMGTFSVDAKDAGKDEREK